MQRSVLPALLLATGVAAAPNTAAKLGDALEAKRSCYGAADASCNYLIEQCISYPGFWTSDSCVAAATCAGLGTLLDAVCCSGGACITPSQEPSLDYNLYAGIVGSCAWASGGCPITQQNYIDFYYQTLTNDGSSVWPSSSSEVAGWWGAITAWTATGSSSPYTNFNDWLHYSSSAPAVGSGGDGGGGGGGGGGIIPPPVGGGGGGGTGGGGGGGTGGGGTGGGGTGGGGTGGGGTGGGGSGGSGGSCTDPSCNDPSCSSDDDYGYKRSFEELSAGLIANRTVSAVPRAAATANNYNIDCSSYPNVCLNWCYYVFCKGGSWDVTVNRGAGNRKYSACASPNRCSYNCNPLGGWTKNPNQGWSCDEQPKNTNSEGGANAATRCMPAGENSGEGSKWSNYINGNSGFTYLSDGTSVTVVLGSPPMGVCASYEGRGTTTCPAAASPSNAAVIARTDDGIRQT